MYNLIMADLYKIRKSKAIKVMFGITTVSAVMVALVAYLMPQGKIDASTTGMWFLFSDVSMISMLGAAAAGIFICGDFDNKIIHEAIATGNSRSSIIIAKALAFFCSLAMLLMPYVIVTIIALSTGQKFSIGNAALGFLNVLTSGSGQSFSAATIGKLLIVILALIIVYLAQLSICVPIALVIKRPILVVVINYGLSMLCGQLMGLKNTPKVFDNIFALTPYGGKYPFLALNTGAGDIIKAIAVSLIFMVVMLAITHCLFRKTEIK